MDGIDGRTSGLTHRSMSCRFSRFTNRNAFSPCAEFKAATGNHRYMVGRQHPPAQRPRKLVKQIHVLIKKMLDPNIILLAKQRGV